MKALLSPSEHRLANRLKPNCVTCSIPESMGADILLYTPSGLYGAQRKEFPHDFLGSMYDGRLARETGLMVSSLDFCELILEGEEEYDRDGRLITSHKMPRSPTWQQVQGMKMDIKYVRGIHIVYTKDLNETIRYLETVDHFMSKEVHVGLFRRPAGKGSWGPMSKNETWLWLLQGFPNIGPGLADKIIQHFGTVPLRWTCSLEELMKVPKIGKGRAEQLLSQLAGKKSEDPTRWGEFQSVCTKRVFGDCWELKLSTGRDVPCTEEVCPLWGKS